MKFVVYFTISSVATVNAFLPDQLPHRRSVILNSLLDEAYDIPSIAGTYSRATSASSVPAEVQKVAEEVAPKVAKVAPKVAKVVKAAKVVPVKPTEVVEATTSATSSLNDATASATSAVDEFVRSANENFPAVKTSVTAAVSSSVDKFGSGSSFQPLTSPLANGKYIPSVPKLEALEEGKVRSMVDYFREGIHDSSRWQVSVPSGETVADAKSKFALMVANTYDLFGAKTPETVPVVPEYAAGWIAAAFATALALNQRNAGVNEAKVAMGELVQKEAAAVSEIAEQLKSMGIEVKKLNEETKALSKELSAAKLKLTEKELALSKERFTAADKELQLNRAIDGLKSKLKEADSKLTAIDSSIKAEEKKIQKTPEKKKAAAKKTVKGSTTVKKVRVVKTATKGEKKSTAKKTTAVKKKVAVKKTTKAKTAKTTAKKKVVTKVKAAKSEEQSWSILSQSTLSRKTIKQLTDYLTSKGVSTTDGDGKTLKKAMLVEAVQAL